MQQAVFRTAGSAHLLLPAAVTACIARQAQARHGKRPGLASEGCSAEFSARVWGSSRRSYSSENNIRTINSASSHPSRAWRTYWTRLVEGKILSGCRTSSRTASQIKRRALALEHRYDDHKALRAARQSVFMMAMHQKCVHSLADALFVQTPWARTILNML